MSTPMIYGLALIAGAVVGGGICLELLHLRPDVASGAGAGVTAAVMFWGLRNWAR
jgi:hypothetical protein